MCMEKKKIIFLFIQKLRLQISFIIYPLFFLLIIYFGRTCKSEEHLKYLLRVELKDDEYSNQDLKILNWWHVFHVQARYADVDLYCGA